MKQWQFALLGLIYAIAYFVLALLTSGGGHGPRFLFAPVEPYFLGLLVFPMLGYLIGYLKSTLIKVVFLLLLIIHYAAVINSVSLWWTDDLPRTHAAWAASPLNILLPVGWYLVGQIILWAVFIRNIAAGREARHLTTHST